MMKKNIFFVSILMVLLVSFVPLNALTVVPTATAATGSLIPVSNKITLINDSYSLPYYKVDFMPYFMELGYTEKEINELSEKELVRILLSNGGRTNIDVSMEEICQNLFGNSTGPIPAPGLDNSIDSISEGSQTALSSTRLTGKACFIVGIWNYPYTTMASSDIADSYAHIKYNIDNYGDYNYVKTLTNSDATHDNVYQWLTWICFSYAEVDIYLYGHGFEGSNNLYGYCCYDGENSNGTYNYDKFYYAYELQSWGIHYYDYSTLRLGLGGFCYSVVFKSYFLNEGSVWLGSRLSPGGGIPQGDPMPIGSDYLFRYTANWGYNWYPQNQISNTAHSNAHTAAMQSQYAGFATYIESAGSSIYH